MRRVTPLAVIALSIFITVLAGCGGGGEGGAQQDWVVGTWEAYEASETVNGARVDLDDAPTQITIVAEFRASGDFGALIVTPTQRIDFFGQWERVPEGYRVTYGGQFAGETELYRRQGDELYLLAYSADDAFWVWLHRM